MGASEANRSWPAVSQISNLIVRVGSEHFCVRKAAVHEIQSADGFPNNEAQSVRVGGEAVDSIAGANRCTLSQRRMENYRVRENNVPPIVGSLFSWKSLLTKRRTSDDYIAVTLISRCPNEGYSLGELRRDTPIGNIASLVHTFPTAASPSNTSLTLLLGLGAVPVDSDMFSESNRS